jgi:hypothetical protein
MNDKEFIAEEYRRINPEPVLSSLEEMLEDDYTAWCKSNRDPRITSFLKAKFFRSSNV